MASTLLPRLYQQEVFDHAKTRNTILRMDTGTGKTLVAIMLIRHITSIPIVNLRPSSTETVSPVPKLVVFIVPTVSLVHQQSQVLKDQTPLRVKSFTGEMGVDLWKREEWLAEINNADVVVCTAQIWLNVLSKAYWNIERISLLILDECHHAMNNHPYARIMKDHYHRVRLESPTAELPRILGMTASPIFNPKNPQKAILELESNLHSRIIEVTSNADVIETFANKPKERLIEYDRAPTVSLITKAEDLLLAETIDTFHISATTWTKITEVKLRLGTFACLLFIVSIVKDMIGGSPAFGVPMPDTTSLKILHQKLVLLLDKTALPSFSQTSSLFDLLNIDTFSPQLITLINLLISYRDQEDFHAIIFVQRRTHAGIIAELVSRVDELKGWLKAGWLVGHGGTGGEESNGDAGMKIREQAQTVAKFRSGELNLIVATQVAEEGLDFKACNVVIRFDPLQTITGYIQSRGRARAPNSTFVVLAEKKSFEAGIYRNYVAQEPELKTMYQNRPEEETDEPDLADLSTYTVPSTGAILTHHASIPLLSEFCSLQPSDGYTAVRKPLYLITKVGTSFMAKVTLPMIACLPGRREFHGSALLTKKAAKQSAAYGICIELHKNGAINYYLLPVRETRGRGKVDADGNILDPTPSAKSVLIEAPNYYGNFRNERSKVYLHVLEVQDSNGPFTIGLVTGGSLDDFEVGEYFDSDPERSVVVKLLKVVQLEWPSIELRLEQLAKLEQFNRTLVQVTLNRRIEKQQFFALWTPLNNDEIDWTLVNSAFLPFSTLKVTPGDTVVVPFRRGNHHLFKYIETRQDVDSLSSTRDVEGEVPNPHRAKIIDRYPEYYIYVKVAFDYMDLSDKIAEPILTLAPMTIDCRNNINPVTSRIVEEFSNKYYPASMCRITSLPDSFFSFYSKTPSILRIIHDTVSTKHALRAFDFPAIDLKQLIVALTPPSVNIGYSYQTLETLGDSALKLATTIHIYLEKPTLDEGQLTFLRQNCVDNKYLNKKCISTNFAAFILADHFLPKKWIPTSSEAQLSSDGTRIVRRIGRRALQDTMEATLGAAYLTGGIQMVLETGTKLNLCFGGTKPWGERESAKVLVELPSFIPPALEALEVKLGYKFRNGRILLQAMTHRSYSAAETHCYEREEHLGDALIDYWTTIRLLARFPHATPRFITYHRAMLVSNPALSLLSTKVLQLQKNILHTSPLLDQAMRTAVTESEKYSFSDMLNDLTWLWDPPKVLGDVFESVIGAIFVDSGFQLEIVLQVLDRMYKDVLPLLRNIEIRDPYSSLVIFGQSIHCSKIKVQVTREENMPIYNAIATFHDEILFTKSSPSKNISRQLVSRESLNYLESQIVQVLLKTCSCKEQVRLEREREKALEEQGIVGLILDDVGERTAVEEEEDEVTQAEVEEIRNRKRQLIKEEEIEEGYHDDLLPLSDSEEPASQRVRIY